MHRIIAEIGLHHRGRVTRAEDLIASAACHGATDVKLQYFTEADLAGRPAGAGWDVLSGCALRAEQIGQLREHAVSCGVSMGCSFFGLAGVRKMLDSGVQPCWGKVPAPQSVDDAVTEAVRGLGVPLVRSFYHTATFARVVSGDTLLHCTAGYPTPDDELHLERIARLPAMPSLRGWSCHAAPRDGALQKLAVRAQSYGAEVFEFHFRDHAVPADSFDYGVSVWPELLCDVAIALAVGE